MSTISGLGSSTSLYTVNNSANNTSQNSVSTDSTSSGGATTYVSSSAVSAASANTANSQQTQQAHPHHHHGHGGGNQELFQKIKSAVTSALQSSQSNGSSDPNQTVQDAISQVLQENGVPGATPSTGKGGSSTPVSGSTSQGASSSGDSRQAFEQLLQSYGIDGQQFHQDLVSAIQKAQTGNADPSTALQSIPSGTVFNTET